MKLQAEKYLKHKQPETSLEDFEALLEALEALSHNLLDKEINNLIVDGVEEIKSN